MLPMNDREISTYWNSVAAERRELIDETHALCSERRVLVDQRRRLLKAYVRLNGEIRASAARIIG